MPHKLQSCHKYDTHIGIHTISDQKTGLIIQRDPDITSHLFVLYDIFPATKLAVKEESETELVELT